MRYAMVFAIALLFAAHGDAQEHPPVAVRWWGQGMVSIETWWNGPLVIDPYGNNIGYEVPHLPADLVLITHGDQDIAEVIEGQPAVVRGLDESGNRQMFCKVLVREPNETQPRWDCSRAWNIRSSRYLSTCCIPAWRDDSLGKERGATAMFYVEVNGVHILHCGALGQSKLDDDQLKLLREFDEVHVLLIPIGGVETIDGVQAWDIIGQVKPRIVVPIHYKTDKLKIPLEPTYKFATSAPANWRFGQLAHNTLAVSASHGDDPFYDGKVVVLDYQPWQPKGELAELLDNMDAACRDSQDVFAELSANQMNWQPPNGSHTPRWNAEHMMGRQLGFFSQIYAAIDPDSFEHIDLNPAQMPPDYKPAHPDWDGAEEARQMQRANAYVRRFAYLLDGIDLDERAPGSRWTLRGLLKQMERHFGEHTANVQKKFELDGWPNE